VRGLAYPFSVAGPPVAGAEIQVGGAESEAAEGEHHLHHRHHDEGHPEDKRGALGKTTGEKRQGVSS